MSRNVRAAVLSGICVAFRAMIAGSPFAGAPIAALLTRLGPAGIAGQAITILVTGGAPGLVTSTVPVSE